MGRIIFPALAVAEIHFCDKRFTGLTFAKLQRLCAFAVKYIRNKNKQWPSDVIWKQDQFSRKNYHNNSQHDIHDPNNLWRN